ncbi:hypothetical protein JCM10369A_01540 [Nocardioides pyridinolyticus]
MWVAVVALVALLHLTACGTASAPSPPAGVDELVVPTPSPDPDDYVADVDNPWFTLRPGTHSSWVVVDGRGRHRVDVTVEHAAPIGGVPVTARFTTGGAGEVVDLYAQDVEGNVWWFGREGEWVAGTGGAEAGLAMPAHPRVGDGYRSAYAEGVVEDRVTVMSLEEDELVTEVRSDLEPGAVTTLTYLRGTGPIRLDRAGSDDRVERLAP